MKILNLTQHAATPEQVADGVFEPRDKALIQGLLTFVGCPLKEQILDRAAGLAEVAKAAGAEAAMIGGAPYLMGALENELKARGVNPLYAFSERVSVETVQPDGSTKKETIFAHRGWVEV